MVVRGGRAQASGGGGKITSPEVKIRREEDKRDEHFSRNFTKKPERSRITNYIERQRTPPRKGDDSSNYFNSLQGGNILCRKAP